MRVLLDTSVLIPAIIPTHEFHDRALPWLERIRRHEVEGVISTHNLAELYVNLTRLPIQPRISSAQAWEHIRQHILPVFEVVPLTENDYRTLLAQLAQAGIIGASTYDGLLIYAAVKADVDQIITLNQRDFTRIGAVIGAQITSP